MWANEKKCSYLILFLILQDLGTIASFIMMDKHGEQTFSCYFHGFHQLISMTHNGFLKKLSFLWSQASFHQSAFLLFPFVHSQLDSYIYQLSHSPNKMMSILKQGLVQIVQRIQKDIHVYWLYWFTVEGTSSSGIGESTFLVWVNGSLCVVSAVIRVFNVWSFSESLPLKRTDEGLYL